MDERPEALLKSALEKIVYFEARSEQLANDLSASRDEIERLKAELARSAQREIELRRHIAELEVRVGRAHAEREELSRMNEALRAERADLIGKLLEASRIADSGADSAEAFDLARFIAELRSEAMRQSAPQRPANANAGTSTAVVAAPPPPARGEPPPSPPPQRAEQTPAPSMVLAHASRLRSEGRLAVSAQELAELGGAQAFPGRSEETLFGFSVRELSAPDPHARIRAAERLKALGHPAAAPALATALHGETEPSVQVALLKSFAELAKKEGVAVVAPLLESNVADVRIAALKALLKLDPQQAGPHLAAAMKDPDRTVRRRASLLALTLSGDDAQKLGEEAIRDADPEVRSLAALVLGAASPERSRPLLLEAMRDADKKVRHAAAQSLSRLLGEDVSAVVAMDDAQRRRKVRRLASLPLRPSSRPARIASSLARSAESCERHADGCTESHADLRADGRAALHVDARADVRAGARADFRGDPRADLRADARADLRADARADLRTDARAELHGDARTDLRATDARADRHADARADLRAGGRADLRPEARAELHATSRSGLHADEPHAVPRAEPYTEPRSELTQPPRVVDEPLCNAMLLEIRTAIRGRTLAELVKSARVDAGAAQEACELLIARGQVVRRGQKFFAA